METKINITTIPKLIEEIFNLKSKRDEAALSNNLELYLYATDSLFIVVRPFIAKHNPEAVKDLEIRFNRVYNYLSSIMQTTQAYQDAKKLAQINHFANWRDVRNINQEIEQFLFDSDLFGGKTNE